MINLEQYNNSGYKHGPLIKRCLWMTFSYIFVETSIPWPSFFKRTLLRFFGAKIGRDVVIKPNVKIKYPWKLNIGDFSWIGEYVWIDNLDYVSIDDNVCISQGVYLLTGNHNYKSQGFDLFTKPINIKSGCWIGAKSIICPGVMINHGAIVTVGSVVTTDLNSMTIYQGNPAIKKKQWESIN